MSNRIQLQPAFVLHTRPYSNTSLLIELYTEHYGRVAVMARSARGQKSRYRGKLQLFYPLLVDWSGRGELKTLGNVEFYAMPYNLSGQALMCGFYMNELLMRLLQRDDPYPILFQYYNQALHELNASISILQILRCFEKRLLERLGYGLPLRNIRTELYYQYIPDHGFVPYQGVGKEVEIFSGTCLTALQREEFTNDAMLLEMKRLMRLVISHHLGSKPLKSRELLL